MPSYQPNTPAYQQDPYPALARLRAEAPVYRSPELGAWVLTSYEACDRALRDDEAFSSNPLHASGGLGESIAATRAQVPLGEAPILGNSDPPEHTRLRAIVNRAFTPRAMEATRAAIETEAARLLDVAGARFELMAGLAEPLVVWSVMEHLGIPAEDRGQFRAAGMAIMRARAEGPAHAAPAAAAHQDLLGLLKGRWAEAEIPETTVLGTLIQAAQAGERLSEDEMLMLLIHISMAGNGPTAYAVGNLVLALGQRGEVQELARSVPGAIAGIVEESLRFDSPTHVVARFARVDTELAGRTVAAGDTAYCVIGAANRDPGRFREPNEFQPRREDNRHLSFGMAAHFCLGAPLARLELQVVVAALREHFGTFRVESMQRGGTFLLRGPKAVLVGPG